MPAVFEILPQHKLALFTYSGFVTVAEAQAVVAGYVRHPGHIPGMHQFCDLSAVTGVEHNFPELFRMQAKFAESLPAIGRDLIVVFWAPTHPGQNLAQMARKSWDGLNEVVVLIQDREADALALLGLPQTSVSSLKPLVN